MSGDFAVGDAVTWLYESRGGYGYTARVPGEVLALGRKRVRIRVYRKNGTPEERLSSREAT